MEGIEHWQRHVEDLAGADEARDVQLLSPGLMDVYETTLLRTW